MNYSDIISYISAFSRDVKHYMLKTADLSKNSVKESERLREELYNLEISTQGN